ncbi:hypothetical protein J421_2367 [Gemmatirosa kalamazoonensis]|uniref:Uncharacterized protein n=1 Tax=Gemmatirosa kalamazoonensis TaxID=861299 RepID=W0RFM5_9BACT|nr:hypothetical protein [Gemmatirosa kalamazoonensis]AHG89904.1 hypothetical protein J421_2367 [Gemmatirosa kalamazoonensis]
MPNDPRPPLPARPALDRAAVERVLARAAELQGAGAEAPETGALTEAQVLEVAREAGIAPDLVRRAIAEERTRVVLPEEHGLAARIAGPGTVSAARIVRGAPAQVAGTLEPWLEREACLRVLRRVGERTLWEPRSDFVGNLKRGLSGNEARILRGLSALALTMTDAGEGQTLVRLDADLSGGRRQRLTAGSVAATGGALAGAGMIGVGVVAHALLAVVVPIAALPLLAGAGVGWALARGHRTRAERVQMALEHVLDQLERGELGPGRGAPLLDVLHEMRRALR